MKRSVKTHMNAQNVKLMYAIVGSVKSVGIGEEPDVVFSVVEMTGVLVVGCWVVLVLGDICVVDSVDIEEEPEVVFSVVEMTVVLIVVGSDVVVGVVMLGVVVVDDDTEVFVVGLCDVLNVVVIFGVVCTVVVVVVSFTYQSSAVNETKKSFVLSKRQY